MSTCPHHGETMALRALAHKPLRPSTGSWNGFLFSVARQMEGLRQLEGGVVERDVMQGSPQVEHVAVGTALGVKALKDVFTQVDGEGGLGVGALAVNRARSAALLPSAAEVTEHAEVLQDLCHGYLLAQKR